jgi:opacity protein-like surface antigen
LWYKHHERPIPDLVGQDDGAGTLSKMKSRYGLAVVAVFAVVASVPAGAQTQPVSIPAKDFGPVWTGFYVGAAFGAGGAVNKLDNSAGGLSTTFNGAGGSGVLGSIYGGVDYQITQRGVLGLLAELSYSGFQGGASAQVPGGAANVNMNTGLGWAVLGRAGVLANPSTLLYLVGGYAGQNIHTDGFATAGGASASFSNDQTVNGWTVGPGFETGLFGSWTGKLEYRYSQFGRTTLAGSNIGLNPSNHAIRAGLSYRFGGLGVASSNEQAPPAPTNVNWTGVYGGVAAGAGMGFGRVNAAAGGASAGFDSGGQGLLGSVFAGADYQFSPYALVGVMGDFTWTGIQASSSIMAPGGGSAFVSAEANRQWSVMGRVGYLPVPSTLLYAAAGYTQLNVHATASAVLPGSMLFASSDTALSGFTVGPGIETVITGGWTTRLEYRFSQFEQKDLGVGVNMQPSNHTIRAGLSYKFGMGSGTSLAQAPD